ncbi:SapC family protein [soil metagenome]
MEPSNQNTTPMPEGTLVGAAPLYSKPQPLSPEQHGKMGLKQITPPWGFAAFQHFVPLLSGEFTVAALSYPIIFAGDAHTPLAVMGINPGENLFFETDGNVRADAYIPAYIRRYPFTVANDEALGRMVVCIDADAKLVSDTPDFPFFDEEGKPTEYTQRCIAFCQDFDQERGRTEAFVKLLTDLDLFEQREARHTPVNPDGTQGESVLIAGYTAISEEKFNALPDDKLLEIRQLGGLNLIYAHLISLNGWDRMIAVAMAKANAAAAAGKTVGNA